MQRVPRKTLRTTTDVPGPRRRDGHGRPWPLALVNLVFWDRAHVVTQVRRLQCLHRRVA